MAPILNITKKSISMFTNKNVVTIIQYCFKKYFVLTTRIKFDKKYRHSDFDHFL